MEGIMRGLRRAVATAAAVASALTALTVGGGAPSQADPSRIR
jgi:hypothetical protein